MSGSRRRRANHEEHVNHEAWAIPYGDLITLLLAFFVVMYSISSINEGKYRAMSDALMKAFNGPSKSIRPVQFGKVNVSGTDSDQTIDVLSTLKIRQSIVPSIRPRRLDATSAGSGAARRVGRQGSAGGSEGVDEARREVEEMAGDIRAALAGLIDDKTVVVREVPEGVEIEIKTDILFASGSADIADDARPTLARLAGILRPLPHPLRIEGHTDDVPIRTRAFPSNWELSAARAASVVQMFIEYDLDPARMSVHGYGQYQPVADNATAAGRNANRRVVVVVQARDLITAPRGLTATGPALPLSGG